LYFPYRLSEINTMIDQDGYRANVGIILTNNEGCVLWAKRIGSNAWQFPQGGIDENETAEQAMYRELKEEIGLNEDQVEIIGFTRGWLRYRLPKRFMRKTCNPPCVGQKQVWFMLHLTGLDSDICFDLFDTPEFDHWKWTNYWRPIREVIPFKRRVYSQALHELAPLLSKKLNKKI